MLKHARANTRTSMQVCKDISLTHFTIHPHSIISLPLFYLSYFYYLHLPAFSLHVVFPMQSTLAMTFSPVEQDTAHLHLPHALMICGKLRASV